MALSDSNDPNKDFINALTYLGKGPFNIGMPGGSDIAVGAGPAPAPGINVGTFGQNFGGGPSQSGAVGAGGSGGGSDILGMLQNFLKAGGKTADFASKLGGGQPQGLDILQSMAGSGEIGLGADTALQGLGTELPNTTLGQTPDFAGLLKELQGTLGGSTLNDPTLGLNLTSGLGNTAGTGAGSLAVDIGTGATGAGALSAILGALASSTGNADLGKAGEALGAAGSAAGLAGTGASLGATGGTLGIDAALLGAEAGTAVPLSAALTAAGAAYAPVAAGLLATSIANMAGADAPSISDIINESGAPGNYPFFGPKLGKTLGVENTDINTLASSLPYASSQQELQNLINTFKTSVGSRVGGYGEGSDPFSIPNLPGAGGSAHEGKNVADFGPEVNVLNELIGQLKGNLPAIGGDAGQLWNQMISQNVPANQAPLQVNTPNGVQYMTPSDYQNYYNQQALTASAAGGALPTPEFLSDAIQFGQPGYNYAGGGLVAPGNAPGAPTDAWIQMISQLTGGPKGPANVAPNPAGAAPNEVYQDLLKQLGVA